MTTMTELAAAVDSRDPATGLAAVAALRRLLDELEAVQLFLPTITVSGGTGVHEYNLAAFGFGPGFG